MRTLLFRTISTTLLILLPGIVAWSQTNTESRGNSQNEGDYKDKSTDELARDLANPNTPLTSLKFKPQFRTYAGSLEGAVEQNSSLVLFQPTLPFPFKNGNKLWVRPGVLYHFSKPAYVGDEFSSSGGFGDITIDFQYGGTKKNGMLWSLGATITMPTASKDELGINQWALGPGAQLGHVSKKLVLGGFLNHQWGLGNHPTRVNMSTLQLFAVFLPAGGWNVGSSPIITYNFDTNGLNLPLNAACGKTIKIGDRPWKFALEVNYYVVQEEPFGPEWMIGLNIAPVVQNRIANWFRN